MKEGFTLIELLVVVLIIGILAGVALPQYEKAVEKSRAVEAFIALRAMKTGEDAYFLANGDTTTPTLLDLDLDIPGKEVSWGNGVFAKETEDFVFYLHPNKNPHAIRKGDKWILGFSYSTGKFFCHSGGNKYEDVCKALGGELVSGDCNTGDGRHCYYLE